MAQGNYTPVTPVAYGSLSVTGSALGLTLPAVPAGQSAPDYAVFRVETDDVRWRDDGTAPTSSVGVLLKALDAMEYDGKLSAIQFIGAGAATASVKYALYRIA